MSASFPLSTIQTKFHASMKPLPESTLLEARYNPTSSLKLARTPSSIESSIRSNPPGAGDVFNNLQQSNHGPNDRKCSDILLMSTKERQEEFEISFQYGVTSSSSDAFELTDDLENRILDHISSIALICASESNVQSEGGIEEMGVIRIRYPEYGEITSMCESSLK